MRDLLIITLVSLGSCRFPVNLISSEWSGSTTLCPILAEPQAAVPVYASSLAWYCPVGPFPWKLPNCSCFHQVQTAHLAGLQRGLSWSWSVVAGRQFNALAHSRIFICYNYPTFAVTPDVQCQESWQVQVEAPGLLVSLLGPTPVPRPNIAKARLCGSLSICMGWVISLSEDHVSLSDLFTYWVERGRGMTLFA